MNISALAQNLKGSEIIKIAAEVNELKAKGKKIANLTIGDFDPALFPIPEKLTNEIILAYQAHQTNYPPADGLPTLRKSISNFLKESHDLNIPINEILVASGSRPLIYATYLALLDPGDKVIYPAPSWNNNHYCDLLNANGVAVETYAENNFMPTTADLQPHVKGATLLALCSPLNPAGTMFSQENLKEICDMVIAENKSRAEGEKPLYILYDQIYAMLTFGGHKHVDPVSLRPELKDYVIYIDGSSKCFSATGVRVGWGFGPEAIISRMRSITGHMGAWAPKAEQIAMSNFLNDQEGVSEFLSSYKLKVQESLNVLYQGFKQLQQEGYAVDAIEPMGAIYLTLKLDYSGKTTPDGTILKDSTAINFYLINHANLALVPFSAFGTGDDVNWFRASVGACSAKDIEDVFPVLRVALNALK